MSLPPLSEYGKLTASESLGLLRAVLTLPVSALWTLSKTYYAPYNQERSVKRILAAAALRFVVSNFSSRQVQNAFGSSLSMYQAWSKTNKLAETVEESGFGGRLLWVGPKRVDRVIVYMHGGGFIVPAQETYLAFWRHVQLELEKAGVAVGIAMFSYTQRPYAVYPTQLKQAVSALNHLTDQGVKPENIILAGDSAGGNLVTQVLSHILHPLATVPELKSSGPFLGAYLISPWTNLSETSGSYVENEGIDYLNAGVLIDWGGGFLKDVPPSELAYVEAVHAPEGWFAGVDQRVKRVLITGGSAEVLKDNILELSDLFKKHHPRTETVIQKDGLHEDMFLDFFFSKEKKLGTLTPLTVEWLAATFKEAE